jgi:hypothetical protein
MTGLALPGPVANSDALKLNQIPWDKMVNVHFSNLKGNFQGVVLCPQSRWHGLFAGTSVCRSTAAVPDPPGPDRLACRQWTRREDCSKNGTDFIKL